MLTSILVGLDGSPYGDVALDLGIEWAKRFDALLVGLGIVDEPTIRSHEPVPIGGAAFKLDRDEFRMAEARGKVEQFLNDFTRRCTEAGVTSKALEDVGLPFKEILRESHRYDLVLLGHETHFHFETADKADETLWRVLRRESRPVVIAPPELRSGTSVVLAYDESPHADRALQAFQASGLDFGQEVFVLCIGPTEETATREADEAVEFLGSHGIRATPCIRKPQGRPGRMILEEVKQQNARMLVMGVSKHSTLRDLLVGGVTKTVLRESPVPVFFCD
jgi:nucleotide-binding universal stress UspA family protein